ncbi:Putative acyl carrier protein, AcpP-like [Desulfonema limicola]|uniref:Acyl carrier protein, AcpP-like n=1 Tax=Desulfonema limicola TaxID=45656 RepID=A0A975B754_9BACT|nr:phosphopantetheine-binding protein [Desulfonema limicola]QTA80119.1 Putative acyl carrier protein, AcpP-like [Desulfonema limicola]
MDLKQQIKEMIVRELNLVDVEPGDIGDDDPLFGEKFGLDSIDAVELVFQIKTHFGVEIRDMKEGRPALQSIKTLTEFIEKRMSS